MNLEQAEYARQIAKWAQSGTPDYNQDEWILYSGKDEYGDISEIVSIEVIREGSCQTTSCIAGRIALDRAPEGTMVVDGVELVFPDGAEVRIADFAADEIGITTDQALAIFWVPVPYASQRLFYVADHPDASHTEIRDAFPITIEGSTWPEFD
jgi:hypothetical protein